MTALQRMQENGFLGWSLGHKTAALGVPRLCSVDVMQPPRAHSFHRETARAERTECSCIIMATLALHPNTLIFHSWHLIQGCTPSSDPSYEELLENKAFFFIQLRLLSFQFSEVFIPKLQILDQEMLCALKSWKHLKHWRHQIPSLKKKEKKDAESMSNHTHSGAENKRNQ